MSARDESLDQLTRDPHPALALAWDFEHAPLARFDQLVAAAERRTMARQAQRAHATLIAAGQPWLPDARGFFCWTRKPDAIPAAVIAANARLCALGARHVGWLLMLGRPELEARIRADLRELVELARGAP